MKFKDVLKKMGQAKTVPTDRPYPREEYESLFGGTEVETTSVTLKLPQPPKAKDTSRYWRNIPLLRATKPTPESAVSPEPATQPVDRKENLHANVMNEMALWRHEKNKQPSDGSDR